MKKIIAFMMAVTVSVGFSSAAQPVDAQEIKHFDKPPFKFYRVSAGDSLWYIGKRYNVPLQDLINMNPQLKNPDVIHEGDIIRLIPEKATTTTAVNFRTAPSTSSAIIRTLPSGTVIDVYAKVNADWVKAGYQGQVGYVSSKYIAVYGNPSSLPTQSSGWEAKADKVIAKGMEYYGTPYLYGASSSRTDVFDCSSFVQRVFREALGIILPRTSREQATVGREISYSELRKGDLMFFATGSDPSVISHVAINAGKNKEGKTLLLHTYRNPEGVILEPVNSYWQSKFRKAVRVIE